MPPAQCAPAGVLRLGVTPLREHLRFSGEFPIPPGFDPLVDGLGVEVSYEPETDPTNVVLIAQLPASGFTRTPKSIRYTDSRATINGVKLVSISDLPAQPGFKRIKINRRGAPLTIPMSGVLRVVLTSGAACVRSCGSTCDVSPTRIRCAKNLDEALCGTISGP